MDWLIENWQVVFQITVIVVVTGLFLYIRYKDNAGRLQGDLEKLLHDGLEYLQGWAGDHVEDVTEEEVCKVANWFYSRYVAGKALERIVSRERLQGLFWLAFTEWRGRFVEVNALMVP